MTELIEAQRDLLTGALEVHLSTVSNRLNEVMRRLAAVATIFLPITFLSGFFGQNFAYMVRTSTARRRSRSARSCSSRWPSAS